jgi:predicted transcriptional regulator
VKKSKLDNPHIKKRVIQELALGKSQGSIAKEVGVSQSQVSRFASRDDIKPFLEKEFMRLVELVPDALDNVEEVIKDKIENIPKNNIKRRKFVLDTSTDALKAVGIMPTPVQSQVITNIYQKNLFITPAMQEILNNHLKSLMSFGKWEENTEKDDES